MKKSTPFAVLTLSALLLGLNATAVPADGFFIRIGDRHGFHSSHSSGPRIHGPVTSFSNSYGPVPSFGGQHRLDGRNRFNLNSTRLDPHPQHQRFKRFHDRFNRFQHKKHDSGFERGFRHGFREGLRQNRSLHERRFGTQSLRERRFSR